MNAIERFRATLPTLGQALDFDAAIAEARSEGAAPRAEGPLRAALERLLASQDIDASVGERIAAITEARTVLTEEVRWNDASPENGATGMGSSATSAPSATRSGDEPTVCLRCPHESRWHGSRGCVATYKNADGETPCRCRAAPRAEGLDPRTLSEAGGNVLDGRRIGSVRLYRNTITPDDWQAIANEYARLSRPSDERVRESEEPR